MSGRRADLLAGRTIERVRGLRASRRSEGACPVRTAGGLSKARVAAAPRATAVVAIVLVALLTAGAAAAPPSLPPPAWILDQIKILTGPEMEGRASGTPGAERAAAHIAKAFREAGLRPGGDAGSYLQSFSAANRP